MAANYYLMHKDRVLTLVQMDELGHMLSFLPPSAQFDERAPLQDKYKPTWLKEWWAERSVPLGQGRIEAYLKSCGYSVPSEYLVRNLGLSLTDCYWLKPVDSDLTWKNINLYENPFRENLITWEAEKADKNKKIQHYSPNSSLQGQIEKTWLIMDGVRYLVKGNRTQLSSESINEVIASEIHRLQGYDNYVSYELLEIHGRDYDYGCRSVLFTSEQQELIPAYALYTSEKKRNNTSPFAHFMRICKKHGLDTVQLQADFDYQTLTDFILSGYDRHLNNFGILRDTESLRLLRMAPIFDSGGSLFAGKARPRNNKALLKIQTNGFAATELAMLKLVKDRNAIDLTRLPPASYIREMYAKDSQMSTQDAGGIAHWYEKKIDMCRAYQLGQDLLKKQFAVAP